MTQQTDHSLDSVMAKPDDLGFSGTRAAKVVGITYRQLDYWARTELLRPSLQEASGSGSQRMYSFTDLVQLKVIKRLLDAGMSLKKIRSAVEILRTQLASDEPLADVTLLSDGHADAFLRFVGQDGSEVTGAAFDPAGTRLIVNSQRAPTPKTFGEVVDGGVNWTLGRTYMISGPF